MVKIDHFYEELPGFFDFQNLYTAEVERAKDGAVFVELGTYCGRSFAYLLVEIANSGKRIEAWTYDIWKTTHKPPYNQWAKTKVFETFHVRGLVPNLAKSDSAEAATYHQNRSVDFVFIDAAHDYASVRRDIAAWWPKVKPGGTFAGHDYLPQHGGVIKAVDEFSKHSGRPVHHDRTSWVIRKPG